MGAFDHPEGPPAAPLPRRSPPVSGPLKICAVVFGVIVEAYVSQKLQHPLGLDGDNDTLPFWAFFLSVIAVLSAGVVGCVLLARSLRRR
jgi:hypothetical protein